VGYKIASTNLASFRLAPVKSAFLRSDLQRLDLYKSANLKFAPFSLHPLRSVFLKSVPKKLAPRKLEHANIAPCKLQPLKSILIKHMPIKHLTPSLYMLKICSLVCVAAVGANLIPAAANCSAVTDKIAIMVNFCLLILFVCLIV